MNKITKQATDYVFLIDFTLPANSREIPRTPANAKTLKIRPSADTREIPRTPANPFLTVLCVLRVDNYQSANSHQIGQGTRLQHDTGYDFAQILTTQWNFIQLRTYRAVFAQERVQDVILNMCLMIFAIWLRFCRRFTTNLTNAIKPTPKLKFTLAAEGSASV